MQGAEAGALDDVIGDVIPIVETELFGQVSEEKEANAFVGGCKEAKRLRAYATYQLLARGITFRDHMSTLLQPVRPPPRFHAVYASSRTSLLTQGEDVPEASCSQDMLVSLMHTRR